MVCIVHNICDNVKTKQLVLLPVLIVDARYLEVRTECAMLSSSLGNSLDTGVLYNIEAAHNRAFFIDY